MLPVALVAARAWAISRSFTAHASSQWTAGTATSAGTRAETTPSTSRADFHAPPPPAGPFV